LTTQAKILIVDDDIFLVTLIETTLKKAGFKINKAYDGEEALKKINEESPDLIILDVMMPKMDGLEVCRILRNREDTHLIPIILLTAKDFIEDKISGLESGADDYIVKPFNVKELIARINGLISKSNYQKRLAEEDKLAALEKLAESIAHEVRNPIVAIGGFARRIHNKLPKGDLLSIYAGHILHEVQRLETMVNEIVKLKTIIISNPGLFDIKKIIDSSLIKKEPSVLRQKILIKKRYCPETTFVYGDYTILETAFLHVIENALEAMEMKGTLTINVKTHDDKIAVFFEDTGKGISKSEIVQIIRPFYTSKMSGAGMGLTIVKHIITLHKGEISISSKKGVGTIVAIDLPRHAETVNLLHAAS